MDKSIEAAKIAFKKECSAFQTEGECEECDYCAENQLPAAIAAYRDAEIERLKAEKGVNERRTELDKHVADTFAKAAYDEIADLRAKLEAAERDAARYRWFRTHENWRDSGPYDDLYEEELDAAIDAARGT